MPISSSITNQYVPPFRIDDLKQDDILIYSNVYGSFINVSADVLPLNIGGTSIINYTIVKDHLSASATGGYPGQFLTLDLNGNLKWASLTNTDPSTIRIGDLLDVDVLGQVSGSILQYDGNQWVIGDHSLDGLTDVSLTAVGNKQSIMFNSVTNKWENRTITLDDIESVNTTGVIAGDVLYWDGSNWLTAAIGVVGGIAFGDLSDVDTTSVVVGDVIYWNGTSWVPGEVSNTGISVEDLTDTTFTAIQPDQVLTWNGTKWVNAHVNYTDILNKPDLSIYAKTNDFATVAFTGLYSDIINTPSIFSGDYNDLTNKPAVANLIHHHVLADITDFGTLDIPANLSDLNDVDVSMLATGNVLTWDGVLGKWKPVGQSPISLDNLSDVLISSPVASQFMKFNGTKWNNSNIIPADISGLGSTIVSYNNQFKFSVLNDIGTPVDGYLKWSSGSLVYDSTISAGEISGLSAVATTGNWTDISGKPTTFTPSSHNHAFTGITDIQILGAPVNKQVLMYNSSNTKWENKTIQFSNITMPVGSDKQLIAWDIGSSSWTPKQLSLSDLSNISITSPLAGQFITYNGTNWTNANITYADIGGLPPAPPVHSHPASQIYGLNPAIVSANGLLSFANLSDSGTKTNGYMKWNVSNVTYSSNIPSTDITGLATVAHTGSYTNLTGIPSTFPPAVHTHTLLSLSDTVSTPTANNWLRWNADGTMVHYVNIDVTDVYGLSLVAQTGKYSDIIDLPTLANVAYTGNWSDIHGVVINWSDIVGKPITFTPSAHSHGINNITGLQAILDNKLESDVGTLPNLIIDYNQVNNPPAIPTNDDFSFSGLNDTSDITPSARANKYLKWSENGFEVEYVPSIPAANISGLDIVISDWFAVNNNVTPTAVSFVNLSDTDDTIVNNGWLRWNANGTAIRYVSSILASDVAGLSLVATTGNYNNLTNKPALFDGKYSSLIGVPLTFAPSTHTHTSSQITDLNISISLDELNDVQISTPLLQQGYTLYWNDYTQKWNAKASSKVIHMDDVSDNPIEDGYFRWDAQGNKVIFQKNISAENITGLSTIAHDGVLNSLNDVDISSVQAGESLVYNGVKWINQNVSGAGVNDSIGSLSDTTITSLTTGDVLRWNGTAWVNYAIPSVSAPSRVQNTDTTPNTSYVETNGGGNLEIVSAGIMEITGANGVDIAATTGNVKIEGIKFPNNTLASDDGKILEYDHGTMSMTWVTKPAPGSTSLLALTDVPDSYSGHANKFVKVNSGGSGVEFVAGTFADATHSHSEYSLASHTHSNYSLNTHNHSGLYAPISHTHTAGDLPTMPVVGAGEWIPTVVTAPTNNVTINPDGRFFSYIRINNVVTCTFHFSYSRYTASAAFNFTITAPPIGTVFNNSVSGRGIAASDTSIIPLAVSYSSGNIALSGATSATINTGFAQGTFVYTLV